MRLLCINRFSTKTYDMSQYLLFVICLAILNSAIIALAIKYKFASRDNFIIKYDYLPKTETLFQKIKWSIIYICWIPAEEVVFRFFMRHALQWLAPYDLFFNSLLFGLAHFVNRTFYKKPNMFLTVNQCVMTFTFGYIALLINDIYASTVLHFVYNIISSSFAYAMVNSLLATQANTNVFDKSHTYVPKRSSSCPNFYDDGNSDNDDDMKTVKINGNYMYMYDDLEKMYARRWAHTKFE